MHLLKWGEPNINYSAVAPGLVLHLTYFKSRHKPEPNEFDELPWASSIGILLWLKKKVARDIECIRRYASHFWESAPSFPGALTMWLKSLVTHRCFAAICQQLIIANLFTQTSAVKENLLSLLNLFIQLLSIFPQNQTAPGLWEIAIHIPRWASQLVPTSMKFPNFNSGSESWIWRFNYSTVIQREVFTGWGIAITCQMHTHPGTDYIHHWPQLNHENNKAGPGQESSDKTWFH